MKDEAVAMTIEDFAEEIEEEVDGLARELGDRGNGIPLDAKLRFIHERLAGFGFVDHALEQIGIHLKLSRERGRYPDLLRMAVWSYLLAERHRRLYTVEPVDMLLRPPDQLEGNVAQDPHNAFASFRFFSPEGEAVPARDWLKIWSARYPGKKYPDEVYQYLLERGPDISRDDVLVMGQWKDAALDSDSVPTGKWKDAEGSVAYRGWNDLAEAIQNAKGLLHFDGVTGFLTQIARRPGTSKEKKRFGLPRATCGLHFLSKGAFPIYDANTHEAIRLLAQGQFNSAKIPKGISQDPHWYRRVFCNAVTRIREQCNPCSRRDLDKALFAYGKHPPTRTSWPTQPSGRAAPLSTSLQAITRKAMTFWEHVADLRRRNAIGRVWSVADLHKNLSGHFSDNTIKTVPFNQSITRGGKVKGNDVQRGMAPKAYRVGRGKFELIDDRVS